MVATIATWEEELREYTMLTGLEVDITLKLLNLKRILPEEIEEMLQTVEITEYPLAKEYAIKQARALQKKKGGKAVPLDLNEDEEEKKKVHFEESPQEEEESYTKDEFLAWMGKGPGKGGKAKGGKGSKGTFQGNCHYCGVYGHRINELSLIHI